MNRTVEKLLEGPTITYGFDVQSFRSCIVVTSEDRFPVFQVTSDKNSEPE